jgi:hypothetical protein
MNRDYDPQTGRYFQSDPLGVSTTPSSSGTAGINHLYGYANQDPLRFVDRLGLEPFKDENGRPCVCKDINIYRQDIGKDEQGGTDYGHQWVEIGPSESYGFWPDQGVDLVGTFAGVPGSVNRGGVRDPHHGDRRSVDDSFSPRPMVWPRRDVTCKEVCERAKRCIRQFAQRYSSRFGSEWRWRFDQGWLGDNSCHTFQSRMFDKCNLGR